MPRAGETVTVTVTHVLGPNKIYAHIGNTQQFSEYQFNNLQEIALKKFNRSEVAGNSCYNTHNNLAIVERTFTTHILLSVPNKFFLARFTDGLIYRARLLSDQNPKFEVI